MKTWQNIWLALLTVACLMNFWVFGITYERIVENTEVFTQIDDHNAQVIEQIQGTIDEHAEVINDQRDCIIELQDLWNEYIAGD